MLLRPLASKALLPLITTRGLSSDLPPLATFTKLSSGTKEDFRRTQAYFAKAAAPEVMTERYLGMIEALKGTSNKMYLMCSVVDKGVYKVPHYFLPRFRWLSSVLSGHFDDRGQQKL